MTKYVTYDSFMTEEDAVRWLNPCTEIAVDCGVTVWEADALDGEFICLEVIGTKCQLLKYYALTLPYGGSLLNGIKRLIYILRQ